MSNEGVAEWHKAPLFQSGNVGSIPAIFFHHDVAERPKAAACKAARGDPHVSSNLTVVFGASSEPAC